MSEASAVPRRLGRYVIGPELGRGMMGRVFRATDPELDRTVALKVVQVVGSLDEVDLASFEQRFMAEARAAAALSHPGIVVVYDVGRDPETGTLFIAFEYLKGRTLAQLTATGSPIEWRTALRLVARTAEALHHAHAQGIIHRDIKPANIMVLPSGEPKVMDFGIAKVRNSDLTAAGEFLGTPSYVSPEQASGAPVDGRSDLFSLGSVLYLLLTGRQPFGANSVVATIHRVVQVDPDPPSRFVPGLPPEADEIVARTLAKDSGDRYPHGELLAQDLDRVLAGQPPDSTGNAPTAPVGSRSAPAPGRPREDDDSQATRALPSARLPQRRRVDGQARPVEPLRDRTRPWFGYAALAGAALFAVALVARTAVRQEVVPSGAPPAPAPVQPRTPLVEPAQLAFALRHSLRDGTVKLWAGEELVLDERLRSSQGQTRQVFDARLPPGQSTLRLEVQAGQASWLDRREASLASGARYELEAILRGLPGDQDAELTLFPVTSVSAVDP